MNTGVYHGGLVWGVDLLGMLMAVALCLKSIVPFSEVCLSTGKPRWQFLVKLPGFMPQIYAQNLISKGKCRISSLSTSQSKGPSDNACTRCNGHGCNRIVAWAGPCPRGCWERAICSCCWGHPMDSWDVPIWATRWGWLEWSLGLTVCTCLYYVWFVCCVCFWSMKLTESKKSRNTLFGGWCLAQELHHWSSVADVQQCATKRIVEGTFWNSLRRKKMEIGSCWSCWYYVLHIPIYRDIPISVPCL